jgi:hypothetical protein
MKQQGNIAFSKANFTNKDLYNSKKEEISNIELKNSENV